MIDVELEHDKIVRRDSVREPREHAHAVSSTGRRVGGSRRLLLRVHAHIVKGRAHAHVRRERRPPRRSIKQSRLPCKDAVKVDAAARVTVDPGRHRGAAAVVHCLTRQA